MAVDAPTSPHARFQGLSSSVAADLDDIFRDAAPAQGPSEGPRAQTITAADRPSRAARASAAGLGAVVAALLAGVSIGSVLTRPPPPPKAPPAETAQVAAVTPAPQALAPAPAVIPAPVTTPAPQPVAERSAPTAAPVKRAKAGATGCQALKGAARARCAYPAVLAADKRLRQAYVRATRAGVSRTTLIGYRNRWAALRRHASDQPTRVVAGYGALAADLNRLAARERRS